LTIVSVRQDCRDHYRPTRHGPGIAVGSHPRSYECRRPPVQADFGRCRRFLGGRDRAATPPAAQRPRRGLSQRQVRPNAV